MPFLKNLVDCYERLEGLDLIGEDRLSVEIWSATLFKQTVAAQTSSADRP